MPLRHLRRGLSSTSRASAPQKLPFEEPVRALVLSLNAFVISRNVASANLLVGCFISFCCQVFESEILDSARRRGRLYANVEYFGDLLVIAAGTAAVARVTYYLAYGKKGGAEAIPYRK